MDDHGESAAARTTWFLLLRRSQGIPDAVDAVNALTVIVGRLAARIDGQGEKGSSTKPTKEAAAVLIDSLLDLGARGELDDCLVTSAAMVGDIKEARGFAQPPCSRITDAAGIPRSRRTDLGAAHRTPRPHRGPSEEGTANTVAVATALAAGLRLLGCGTGLAS